MSEQNIFNNTYSEANDNQFWLTRPPPPPFMPFQPTQPMYNVDYKLPFTRPPLSPCYVPAQNHYTPHSGNIDTQYFQDLYAPSNQSISNTFQSLPENIDEEYILKYLCPLPKALKDETSIWIEKWLASKETEITINNLKSTNAVEVHSKNDYHKPLYLFNIY